MGLGLALAAPAGAAVEHTVMPGESLTSIASANGLTPAELAAHNGLAADARLVAGRELEIPDPGAGAGPPVPWVVAVHHPSETPYLAEQAAAEWEALRQESLRRYGIDLYPVGALSGYRTYAQQAHLYRLWRKGDGNLAAAPGTSVHELGTAVDLATPEMRWVVDEIGARFGWRKIEAPREWWHVNYVGG